MRHLLIYITTTTEFRNRAQQDKRSARRGAEAQRARPQKGKVDPNLQYDRLFVPTIRIIHDGKGGFADRHQGERARARAPSVPSICDPPPLEPLNIANFSPNVPRELLGARGGGEK